MRPSVPASPCIFRNLGSLFQVSKTPRPVAIRTDFHRRADSVSIGPLGRRDREAAAVPPPVVVVLLIVPAHSSAKLPCCDKTVSPQSFRSDQPASDLRVEHALLFLQGEDVFEKVFHFFLLE